MKALLFLLAAIVSFTFFGCNKDSQKTVFKAKYIGQDCAPVIQILEPLDKKFKESDYLYRSTECNYCVATGTFPEEYKNGQPFYFTIKLIKETKDFDKLENCAYPKYIIDIENFSDTLFTN
jgi:hypothetical protein